MQTKDPNLNVVLEQSNREQYNASHQDAIRDSLLLTVFKSFQLAQNVSLAVIDS